MVDVKTGSVFLLLVLLVVAAGYLVLQPRLAAVSWPSSQPPALDWSDHSQQSHPGAFAAISSWISLGGNCHFRECGDGTAYLVCWDLNGRGEHGLVPLVARGDRWVAKTAFWTGNAYLQTVFEAHGCLDATHPAAMPPIEWEVDDDE